MKKVLAAVAVGVLAIAPMACEPVQSICNDAPKYERAISAVDAENIEFKQELLGDVAETAAAGNCPGYEGMGEED